MTRQHACMIGQPLINTLYASLPALPPEEHLTIWIACSRAPPQQGLPAAHPASSNCESATFQLLLRQQQLQCCQLHAPLVLVVACLGRLLLCAMAALAAMERGYENHGVILF